tara:strand:+ start:3534 stop:3737 length:204 start_codon:yes stop_codon:yes gene_type:complete
MKSKKMTDEQITMFAQWYAWKVVKMRTDDSGRIHAPTLEEYRTSEDEEKKMIQDIWKGKKINSFSHS